MYLGIDVGTSSTKVVLMDDAQRILVSADHHYGVERPHPGWSEQDPALWIGATEHCLDQIRASHAAALSGVRGIGLSGQMHGATLLDRADRVLRPSILWNDTRSHAEAAALDADARFRAITGNVVFPGFTAPKLAWVAVHEPALFAQVRWVLLPKDYVRLWLTGEHMSDLSDASGTAWLDVGARRWSGDLLAATGLEERHMPNLVEGTDAAGTLRPDLAARWGIAGPVVVAGGAGDNAASACGMGTVVPGAAFVSIGTSGVLFSADAGFMPNAASAVHAFCHALPGTWHRMGVILSAAASLEWLAGITGRPAGDLTRALGETLSAPQGLFLPYLAGERTPHNDALIRGAFTGLAADTTAEDLTRSVLTGVAFAFRDSFEAMGGVARATAVGGGSRSRWWLKAIATTLGIPIDVPQDGEFGAALGAARLGLIAAEAVADPASVCTAPPTVASIEPDPNFAPAFGEAYQRWRALYPAIRGVTT
jgi:xylulokinase